MKYTASLSGFAAALGKLVLAAACAVTLASQQSSALSPGESLQDFSVMSNQGKEVALSNFKGKIVYVDIWASWCQTCKESLSWMHSLQKRFGDKLQIIAVSVDQERKDAERAIQDSKADLLVGFDPDGKLPERYNVSAMPTSFLIGRDGKIIAVNEGLSDKEKHEIEKSIEQQI